MHGTPTHNLLLFAARSLESIAQDVGKE